MKKLKIKMLLVAVAIATATNISYSQTPYDNFVKTDAQKPMLKLPNATFKAFNTDTTSEIKYIELDKELYTISYFNEKDSLIKTLQLEPTAMKWWVIDPKSGERVNVSPYNFVQNNPINRIDPTGELDDWVENANGDIYWDNNATSQATTKAGETYLGKAVVVFNGSVNEKLGTYPFDKHGDLGKNVSMSGEGAVLANVTVYGPGGSNDVHSFEGYSMSSNPSKFGVMADGDFTVNRVGQDNLGPYGSPWVVERRGAEIPAMNGINPAYPERNPGYLTNVFVHRPNNDGWTGTYTNSNGLLQGVSEGCLLIAPNQWNTYQDVLKTVNSYHLKLNRQ